MIQPKHWSDHFLQIPFGKTSSNFVRNSPLPSVWTNFASSERFPLKNAPNVATLKGKSHQIEANSHDVVVRSEKKRGTAVITRSFEVQGGVVVVVAAMFEMFVFFWGWWIHTLWDYIPVSFGGQGKRDAFNHLNVRDDPPSRFQRFKAPPEIPCWEGYWKSQSLSENMTIDAYGVVWKHILAPWSQNRWHSS